VTILAIDTCETHCSAALLLDDGQSYARSENIGRGHAERLLPLIDELLAEAALAYGDITLIAVTTGPGTFTGLRIGLSVARGLALSLAVPCVGISALRVLAEQADVKHGPVHAVIKGRGGQVFYQPFDRSSDGALLFASADASNCDAIDVEKHVAAAPGPIVGSGAALINGREPCLGDAVNPVVLARLVKTLAPEDHLPEPFYLRAADAAKANPILNIAND